MLGFKEWLAKYWRGKDNTDLTNPSVVYDIQEAVWRGCLEWVRTQSSDVNTIYDVLHVIDRELESRPVCNVLRDKRYPKYLASESSDVTEWRKGAKKGFTRGFKEALFWVIQQQTMDMCTGVWSINPRIVEEEFNRI